MDNQTHWKDLSFRNDDTSTHNELVKFKAKIKWNCAKKKNYVTSINVV